MYKIFKHVFRHVHFFAMLKYVHFLRARSYARPRVRAARKKRHQFQPHSTAFFVRNLTLNSVSLAHRIESSERTLLARNSELLLSISCSKSTRAGSRQDEKLELDRKYRSRALTGNGSGNGSGKVMQFILESLELDNSERKKKLLKSLEHEEKTRGSFQVCLLACLFACPTDYPQSRGHRIRLGSHSDNIFV